MFPILLASSSPRRRQLLEQVGFCVTTRPAEIDETPGAGEPPIELARRLAGDKARASLAACDTALPRAGIAADTVVWTQEGRLLGKPADEGEARRMIGALAGSVHRVTTGYAIFDTRAREVLAVDAVTTEVEFDALAPATIAAYAATGEGMDKAGAYGIQGLGAVLVRGIRGSYANVVGLPVEHVVRSLRAAGMMSGMPWEDDDGSRVRA